MDNAELQVENGHFTRIVNPLIERLIQLPFKGCELAVAMFIIRKTYGFQKTEDEISLTQFEDGLKRSRPTIVCALKNLQLVKVVELVKSGTSKKHSNLWRINKYYDTWELVRLLQLVKRKGSTSKDSLKKLVKVPLHTKETYKRKTKESEESESQSDSGLVGGESPNSKKIPPKKKVTPEMQEVFELFQENPAKYVWNMRTHEREAAAVLHREFGIDTLRKRYEVFQQYRNDEMCPQIHSPAEFLEKMPKMEKFLANRK